MELFTPSAFRKKLKIDTVDKVKKRHSERSEESLFSEVFMRPFTSFRVTRLLLATASILGLAQFSSVFQFFCSISQLVGFWTGGTTLNYIKNDDHNRKYNCSQGQNDSQIQNVHFLFFLLLIKICPSNKGKDKHYKNDDS